MNNVIKAALVAGGGVFLMLVLINRIPALKNLAFGATSGGTQ